MKYRFLVCGLFCLLVKAETKGSGVPQNNVGASGLTSVGVHGRCLSAPQNFALASTYNEVVYKQVRDRSNLALDAFSDSQVYAEGEKGFKKWQSDLLNFLSVDFIKAVKEEDVEVYILVHRWRLATANTQVLKNLKQFGGSKDLIKSVSAGLEFYGDRKLNEIADRIQRPIASDLIDK